MRLTDGRLGRRIQICLPGEPPDEGYERCEIGTSLRKRRSCKDGISRHRTFEARAVKERMRDVVRDRRLIGGNSGRQEDRGVGIDVRVPVTRIREQPLRIDQQSVARLTEVHTGQIPFDRREQLLRLGSRSEAEIAPRTPAGRSPRG